MNANERECCLEDRFGWPCVAVGEAASPADRSEIVVPGKEYRQLGVRLWGKGAYARESIDGVDTKYKTLNRVASGDIVVSKIWARNGSVSVVQSDLDGCYVSGEFPLYSPESGALLPDWFLLATKCRWFWHQCDELSRGTSGKNRIKPSQFLRVKIPLPPLPEQKRIVAKVQSLTSKIDEARELRADSTASSRALVSAMRAQLFEAQLGGETVPLSSAALLERGKFSHRPRNEPRFFGGPHPWIQIAEVEAAEKHITSWTATLNDDGLAISRKFPQGTILVSIAATIGAVGILNFDCCVPDSIVAVTPNPDFSSDYLYHYLCFIRTNLESIAPQSAQKNINLRILSPLPVPMVSLEEQTATAETLDAFQAQADALADGQSRTDTELSALTPSILDRAFKGQL